MTVPAPANIPTKNEVNKKIRLPEDETAAKASSPIKRPTTNESKVLYRVWNKLLRKIGMANVTMSFQGEPFVMSLVFFAVVIFVF